MSFGQFIMSTKGNASDTTDLGIWLVTPETVTPLEGANFSGNQWI